MTARRLLTAMAAVAILSCLAGSARAAQGPYFWGYGWGYWGYPPLRVVASERMPYYALYPPVYYGQVIPRPYGQSPFAYPPETPEPEAPRDVASTPPPPPPLLIVNPYVTQRGEVSSPPRNRGGAAVRPAAGPTLRPLVVYPAAGKVSKESSSRGKPL